METTETLCTCGHPASEHIEGEWECAAFESYGDIVVQCECSFFFPFKH